MILPAAFPSDLPLVVAEWIVQDRDYRGIEASYQITGLNHDENDDVDEVDGTWTFTMSEIDPLFDEDSPTVEIAIGKHYVGRGKTLHTAALNAWTALRLSKD